MDNFVTGEDQRFDLIHTVCRGWAGALVSLLTPFPSAEVKIHLSEPSEDKMHVFVEDWLMFAGVILLLMSIYISGTGKHLILISSFSGLPVVQWYVISYRSPFPPCIILADWHLCSAVDLRPENRRESAQPPWILSLYHSRQNTIGHLYSVNLWAPLHTNQALKIDASGAKTFTGNIIWLQSFTFTG